MSVRSIEMTFINDADRWFFVYSSDRHYHFYLICQFFSSVPQAHFFKWFMIICIHLTESLQQFTVNHIQLWWLQIVSSMFFNWHNSIVCSYSTWRLHVMQLNTVLLFMWIFFCLFVLCLMLIHSLRFKH